MDKIIAWTVTTFNVSRIFFGFDEMRGFNRDSRSRAANLTNAESLAKAVNALQARPYSLPVHSFHTRRDRVASLTTCRLHGAAIQRASPLGPDRALTLPCRWNNAGCS